SASVTVLNPDSSALTWYLPVGRLGAVYSPAESLTTVRVNPVPELVSVMVAPGMTAPVLSVTVPRMVPVTAWAASDADSRPTAMMRPNPILFTCVLHAPAERRRVQQLSPRRDRVKSPAPPRRRHSPLRCRPACAAAVRSA